MINKNNILLLLLLLSMACHNDDSKNSHHVATENCSSLIEKEGNFIVTNYYYETIDKNNVLAVKKSINLSKDVFANFSITPVLPKEKAHAWEINFAANTYRIHKHTLTASSEEEGKETSYSMYNTTTGELLLPYTYDKFNVLFSDESKKRFIGFYSRQSSNRGVSTFTFDDDVIGYISYANEEHLLKQIKISCADKTYIDALEISAPVIELTAVNEDAMAMQGGKTLYFSNTEASVNFDIIITFYTKEHYEERKLTLQVVNDQLIANDDGNTVFKVESY